MATLGDTTQYALANWDPVNYGDWFGTYTAASTGTLSTGFVYTQGVSGGPTVGRIAVYNDSSGIPGTFVDVTAEISTAANAAAAWQSSSFNHGASITNGSLYWLCWLSGSGNSSTTSTLSGYKSSGGTVTEKTKSAFWTYASTGDPPNAPASGFSTTSNTAESMYANYTATGASLAVAYPPGAEVIYMRPNR